MVHAFVKEALQKIFLGFFWMAPGYQKWQEMLCFVYNRFRPFPTVTALLYAVDDGNPITPNSISRFSKRREVMQATGEESVYSRFLFF